MSRSDWEVFRSRVPEWRERYLRLKNEEFIGSLSDETSTPTERFWRTKEQIDEEARVLQACFDGHTKGKMAWFLSLVYRHGMIGEADLNEFSAELREKVRSSLHLSKSES